MNDLVLAITGASGAVYASRLLQVLCGEPRVIHLVLSQAATEVIRVELNTQLDLRDLDSGLLRTADPGFPMPPLPSTDAEATIVTHHINDLTAPIASGSFRTAGMVICPCSMGTLACLAHGISHNLIHRAANVHLKERRKLIVVPRESPLGTVELDNMSRLSQTGAVVLPAMPGFYHQPQTVAELVDFVVARICDQLGVAHSLVPRWGESDGSGRD